MTNKFGMTDKEVELAHFCADFVMDNKQNQEILAVTALLVCSSSDIDTSVSFIASFASAVLYNYISGGNYPADLADQLFGKHIKGQE